MIIPVTKIKYTMYNVQDYDARYDNSFCLVISWKSLTGSHHVYKKECLGS